MQCGHLCTFDCHSGKCSKERDCIIKIPIKCACKTLKRSVLCKELKFEKDKMIEKTIKGEKKLFIHCNEKCEIKQKKAENSKADSNEISPSQKTADKNESQDPSYIKYLLVGFLVLIVSILIFFLNA